MAAHVYHAFLLLTSGLNRDHFISVSARNGAASRKSCEAQKCHFVQDELQESVRLLFLQLVFPWKNQSWPKGAGDCSLSQGCAICRPLWV